MSLAPSPAPLSPRPPGTDVPATCEVPQFAPIRVRGGRHRLRRLVRHRQRAMAAGLAVTAAALLAAGSGAPAEPPPGDRARGHPVADRPPGRPAAARVTAPVRIADAATVRLLRPGDRVDVIAAEEAATGGEAHVVARGARVTEVPEPLDGTSGHTVDGGALVVLSVPRATAARLVGASATARLAVTLC
ncbi:MULTISPECIES: RcpC/CpaB family pilus assembly protein [Streptomyces]|uniref:RcpC/CpaB family pilus assembly protein n=1 Tax=Streptomyces TaxID=1883 RepID=UPI000A38996B|nr:RcpC/CpaB family pilus assembly protein [Streptomyces glaucescens]